MATEKRLIDANALIDDLEAAKANGGMGAMVASTLIRYVKRCPTVYDVEVVHGHMVERIVDHECPWYTVYDCSECGCSVERWHSYCPNCGAKMRGSEE